MLSGEEVTMTSAALILAAGAGTRMISDLPKVAHPVLGVPMIQLVVDAALTAGVDQVIAVTGHRADVVEGLMDDVRCVRQEQRLGTGHAVMCARDVLSDLQGSLVVLSGDTPLLRPETIRRLVETREKADAAAAVLVTRTDDPSGYGRIVRDDVGELAAIVEHKDLAAEDSGIDEVNTGTYCFDVQALLGHLDHLSDDNSQGEYYLTDMIEHLRGCGMRVVTAEAVDSMEVMGVNTRVQLAAAGRVLQQRVNEKHMLAGVTIVAPDLAWISPSVKIGRDSVIEPMTYLTGDTVIGEGCRIGPNTRITDSSVGDGANVDSSVVLESRIAAGSKVGPMSYLRPGATLELGSKVGTFVEIKDSTIGPGSKVPHLSYIGDARIGAGVNVGAGSITCNYDGQDKHITEIGDGAFIGSDTMLVAPVRVGSGSVVGAGSVITRDVLDDSLSIGRGRQEDFRGWAARLRARRARGQERTDTTDKGESGA